MINGHGNNIADFSGKVKTDFSSNVFNHPKTSLIIDHIKENTAAIGNYPDCNCALLRTKIAAKAGLNADHVLVCNGSTEAFYLLAHLYKQQHSVIPVPSFSEYADACRLYNHSITFPDSITKLHSEQLRNKVVWLGNPNNPDGKYLPAADLLSVIQKNPDTLFIVDEAYIELCRGAVSVQRYVAKLKNLVVIKSFAKLFAIPGIRLGYVLAHPELIEQLRQLHMPWAVNALALKAGEFIVDHLDIDSGEQQAVLASSKQLQKQIDALRGFTVVPSDCNYFLVKLSEGNAERLQDYLLHNFGFLIRNASNFKGLNDCYIRIASQGSAVDTELVNALREWEETRKNELFTNID